MAGEKLAAMLGVFALSLLASIFPTLSKRLKFLSLPHTLFFILKHFGTGVILSTAFVHLLQDAFRILLALPDGTPVKPWVGLIVLAAMLAIFLVEYISMAYVESLEELSLSEHEEHKRHHHRHHHGLPAEPAVEGVTPHPTGRAGGTSLSPLTEELDPFDSDERNPVLEQEELASERTRLLRTVSTPAGVNPRHRKAVRARHISAICRNFMDDSSSREWFSFLQRRTHHHPEDAFTSNRRCCESSTSEDAYEGDVENGNMEDRVHDHPNVTQKRAIVNTLVLQAGIMLHSVIVGFTLSIKDGAEFTSLLIAILFHQLFEGLSLGVRIAQLDSVTHERTGLSIPIVLSFIFATAVPAGCLFGHFTVGSASASTNPNVPMYQGITSAVSAGTLIYASGVELLAGDFLHSDLRQSSVGKQVLALVSLAAGAAGMAVLAAFD